MHTLTISSDLVLVGPYHCETVYCDDSTIENGIGKIQDLTIKTAQIVAICLAWHFESIDRQSHSCTAGRDRPG